MKKFLGFALVSLLFLSCTTDVRFNNPGFTALKENFAWRSSLTDVTIVGSNIVIKAYNNQEVVTLTIPAPTASIANNAPQTFELGELEQPSAQYTSVENGVTLEYTTGEDLGDGQVVINEYNLATKELTGTFRFNAKYMGTDESIPKNINFQKGNFYKIQVK